MDARQAKVDAHDGAGLEPAIRSLVVSLCRRDPLSPAARGELARLDDASFRARFLELARNLRVLGVVLVRLDREAALSLSDATMRELRAVLRNLRHAAAGYELERDRVLARLRRDGVDPVALKGAALRGTLYTEPAERQAADIDLLVSRDEWQPALQSLLRSGYLSPSAEVVAAYERHHFHLRLQHLLGYVVELHWALTKPEEPFKLDPDAFRAHSVPAERRTGTSLRVPRNEHMLLHLVLQSVSESFLTFSRIVDVDRIVSRGTLDWDFIAVEAQRAGLSAALTLTVELAQQLLGTEIPASVGERLRLTRGVRVHVDLLEPAGRMLAPIDPRRSAADRLMDFWLLPTARDRAGALSRLLAEGSTERVARTLGESAEPVSGRVFSLVKLFAYQASLYLAAARRPAPVERDHPRITC
ncbi:MAG TPA: nucleotidyltransferase family protein [Gemmatimonadaceae bacterium]|nr:nucleotidyltransferase family protein [Gemmatimonadaceae bacterium]